jgi:hypothetical protein
MADDDPRGARIDLSADVDLLTNEILREWRQRLRRRADDRARSGDRGENERLLVAAILRASQDDGVLPGLAAAAAQYGAGQRRDRLDPNGLCDELSCLRQIVWSELKAHARSVNDAVDRILRVDRALSIVVKAALTAGYEAQALGGEPHCPDEPVRADITVRRGAPDEER